MNADAQNQRDAAWSAVRVARVRGRSRLVTCRCVQPLTIWSPTVGGDVVALVQSSYGGGFVEGDAVRLRLAVEPGASAFLTTQANTRVYRRSGTKHAEQRIAGDLAAGATAVVLPDPVVLHAEAAFRQEQHWRIHDDATLVLLDWMQCGRSDSGEIFAYAEYDSILRIARGGRMVVLDPLRSTPSLDPRNPARFGPFHLVAALYLVGPRIDLLVHGLAAAASVDHHRPMGELPARARSAPSPEPLISLSLLEPGVAVLRAAAETRRDLDRVLTPLAAALAHPDWLGFDVQQRRA